ncbi:MAG TPA: 2-amino-4-hydroxy-6-hydroxymethyldihydropteridine diphosphokinase [Verrucomicrobiota bacterium]|nr:2-amino-4-hydroxy-6-hydroxymethyldihydropteridine diphosphokinase [Verrucomicrobiota bacterium]
MKIYLPDIYVGLGSNLGDSKEEIRRALGFLKGLNPSAWAESSLWISSPVECPEGSGDFHNAAAGLRFGSEIDAERLLDLLQEYERQRGRVEGAERNSPRKIDLDILYFRGERRSGPRLVIPHPRAVLRRFVMEPLAEIAPELRLEAGGETAERIAALLKIEQPAQRVERLI